MIMRPLCPTAAIKERRLENSRMAVIIGDAELVTPPVVKRRARRRLVD